MSGGQRYWNEDAQRWEDGTGDSPATPTSPPPPRPERAPNVPAADTAPVPPPAWPPAAGQGEWPPAAGQGQWPPAAGQTAWPPAATGAESPTEPGAGRAGGEPGTESAAGGRSGDGPEESSPGGRGGGSPEGLGSRGAGEESPARGAGAGDSGEALPDGRGARLPEGFVPKEAGAETSPGGRGPGSPGDPASGRSGAGLPCGSSGGDPGAEAPTQDAPGGSGTAFPAWPPVGGTARTSVYAPDDGHFAEAGTSYPGGWPPPDGQPDEPPAGRTRRLWPVLAAAAVVGAAVGFALVFALGGDGEGRHTAQGSSTSAPAPTGNTESSPSADPSPSASRPPEGYEVRPDREGFRIAVPVEWTRSSAPSMYGIRVVNYRSPDRSHRLQIYQVAEQSPDASFELYLSPDTRKPDGFEKLDLRNMDDGDFTGSRLEYLADTIRGEPDVGTWHVLDERFVAGDGRIYAIAVYGPDSDGRDDELELLTTALKWFCPPDTGCDARASVD
ncbi:hypothetical protein [Streptomyces sp. NPDC005004]